jgi:hypothetical protein
MKPEMRRCFVLCIVSLPALACGGAPDSPESSKPESSDIGQVRFALTSVPTGIQCIQATVNLTDYPWTLLATQNFAATAGASWSGTVALGSFTTGSVRVAAQAYNVACNSIGTTPNWVSDTTTVSIRPGVPGAVTLNFRQNYGVVASANFAPSVADISVGTSATGLRLADNTVRMVGTFIAQPTSLTNVAELSVALGHACARKTDGTVWCWGQNNIGQLGNGTTTANLTTPVQAQGITGASMVATGFHASCASTSTGTYCWGFNASGALGNGNTTDAWTPSLLAAPSGGSMIRAYKIAISDTHACAAATDGVTYCWGNNAYGQLGTGGNLNSWTPVSTGLRGVVSVAVSQDHSCAVTADGKAWCWGKNDLAQLGNLTTTNSSVPVQVMAQSGSGLLGIAEIACGWSTTCARTTSGTVYCWGSNSSGALGLGDSGSYSLLPNAILSTAQELRIGGSSGCALMFDDSVQCWGDNNLYQLGDGTQIPRYAPVPMQL